MHQQRPQNELTVLPPITTTVTTALFGTMSNTVLVLNTLYIVFYRVPHMSNNNVAYGTNHTYTSSQ